MKPIIPFALLGALLTVNGAFAASTTPVGYTSQTIKAGQFNLVGLTLHNSISIAGTFETKPNTTSISDAQGTFTTALTGPAGSTYILEITSGTMTGAIQEFTTFTATDITGLPASFVAGLTGTESYKIRASATIQSVFGAANESGLLAGNANSADIILVPNGAGGFDSFFYSSGGFTGVGWRKVGGGSTNFANQPIVYTDSILVQRRGATDLTLTVTGEVKTTNTLVGVTDVFQYLSSVYPVGTTLGNSGLDASVLKGNANTADLILVPNGTGGYVTYFYSSGGFTGIGWRQVGGGSADQAGVALPSGVILNRRQAPFNANLTPPASYTGL